MNKIPKPAQVSFYAKRKSAIRKGAIVVLFAILLPVQMIFLGFTIDFANMHRVRNEARVIADLSSKAAADTLARSGGDEALAISTAQAVAASNTIGGEFHSLDPSEIVFGRAQEQADGRFTFTEGATPSNSVRVFANRTENHPNGPVGLFFGNFYGQSEFPFTQTATSSFRDVELCLVLDRSISMKYNVTGSNTSAERRAFRCQTPSPSSRWIALDNAVEVFLSELDATPVRERVGVVTFATDTNDSCTPGVSFTVSKLDQPLTENTAAIRAVMDDYNTSVWFGGTDITAGIVEATDHMVAASNPSRDRFIVVLTDGVHRNENTEPSDAAAAANQEGLIVHTITFSPEADTADMQLTAQRGGGQHWHADTEDELELIFQRLAGSLAILTE